MKSLQDVRAELSCYEGEYLDKTLGEAKRFIEYLEREMRSEARHNGWNTPQQ